MDMNDDFHRIVLRGCASNVRKLGKLLESGAPKSKATKVAEVIAKRMCENAMPGFKKGLLSRFKR